MSILVSNIINSVVKKTYDNVFVFGLDGFYDACLARLFNQTFAGRELFADMSNLKSANTNDLIFVDRIPLYRNIELVINNDVNIFSQKASQIFGPHIRRIYVEHRYTKRLKKEVVIAAKNAYKNAQVIFSNQDIQNDWQLDGLVIPEFIEESIKQEENKTIDVVIYGHFDRNDYGIIHEIQKASPNTVIIGDNIGLSKPMNYENMLKTIAGAKILVTLTSGIYAPPRVLEAAIHGAVRVSNQCDASVGSINDSYDGILCKNLNQMPGIIRELLNNESWRTSIAANAAERVQLENNREQFLQKWSDALYG